MSGKVCVITGATSGIGQAAAVALAGMGAKIALVARDRTRGETTLARLRAAGPAAEHSVHYADLTRVADMKRVGTEIAAAEPRIDVLINNAGAVFNYLKMTDEGFERTFALNHLSYFVLAHMLRDRLFGSAPARVINTSSRMHRAAKLDFNDLQSLRSFGPATSYGRSKLYNVLFTRELARRWGANGITANCLHPGFVATRIGDEGGGIIPFVMRLGKKFGITPEEGAKTIVYLASSPEVASASGQYFTRCQQVAPGPRALDDDGAKRLWEETARLTGLG